MGRAWDFVVSLCCDGCNAFRRLLASRRIRQVIVDRNQVHLGSFRLATREAPWQGETPRAQHDWAASDQGGMGSPTFLDCFRRRPEPCQLARSSSCTLLRLARRAHVALVRRLAVTAVRPRRRPACRPISVSARLHRPPAPPAIAEWGPSRTRPRPCLQARCRTQGLGKKSPIRQCLTDLLRSGTAPSARSARTGPVSRRRVWRLSSTTFERPLTEAGSTVSAELLDG